MRSAYSSDDVNLLVTDLTGRIVPVSLEERARRVAVGEFERSIMIKEYPISQEYRETVWRYMYIYAQQTADAIASLGEQLFEAKGKNLVLVSIVRAATPIGVLLKRYLNIAHGINVPHYSISLVRGLDANAMKYILSQHRPETIQFVDGWTGKGTVTRELVESAKDYPGVEASLATLSDAIGVSKYCGNRHDIAIPSAPLNATVTGLVSITIVNNALVSPTDFHGAMYLDDLEPYDKSGAFLELITDKLSGATVRPAEEAVDCSNEIVRLAAAVSRDKALLNPGVNEAARAILRRDLEFLFVVRRDDFDVQCICELAELKGVPIVEYPLRYYKAVSIARR